MASAALQKQIRASIDHTNGLLDVLRIMHDGKIPPELLLDLPALRCACEVEMSTSESVTLAAKEHIRSMDDLNFKNQITALRCDAPRAAAEPAQQLVVLQPSTFPAQPATPELSDNEYKLLSAASEAVCSISKSYAREQSATTLATSKMLRELAVASCATISRVTECISDAIRDTTMHTQDAMSAAHNFHAKIQLDVARHGFGLDGLLDERPLNPSEAEAQVAEPLEYDAGASERANLFAHAKHTSTVLAGTANHIATEKKEAVMACFEAMRITISDSVGAQRGAAEKNQDSQNELFEKNAAAQMQLFEALRNP